MEQLGGVVLVGDVLMQRCSDRFGELGIEADRGVVAQDGGLDLVHVHVGLGAGGFLAAPAEEVPVGAAVALRSGHDHSGLAALVMAAPAPQRALEVVVRLALSLAGGAAAVEDLLDLVEDLRRDKGLVTALVLDAVVGDVAEVVAVA